MSDYPSDGWAYGPSPKKKKKGKVGKQYTSYRLPRLDEVVLLQPISTRADGQQKEENTRLATVDDQLERYNRWLAFTQASRPSKDVRSTAADIQLAVYELNALIASMMIKVDQKIAAIQDSTEEFVEAVKKEGAWQTNGDLLDLTYEELDDVLTKHPRRSSEPYSRHLCDTVRMSRIDPCTTSPERRLDKLLRLINEVQRCDDGDRNALHSLIFVKTSTLPQLDEGPMGLDSMPFPRGEGERVDAEVKRLVRASNANAIQKHHPNNRVWFDFADAARFMFHTLPKRCRVCHRPPPDPPAPPAPPGFVINDPLYGTFPRPSCARAPYLHLLQTVQQWAYSEILSGIMLTIGTKLPKELCLLVFEYAMQAEGLPLDPRVWEADDFLIGMCISGGVKKEYACAKPGVRMHDDLW